MNVVIVAGGLGTRFKELSVFPKILLPTERCNSIIQEDINRFKGNKMYLIINERFYNMVNNYVSVNHLDIEIIKTSNCNGSYNTIKSVYDKLPHENVLFFWSDLIINEDIPVFDKNTVVVYNGGKYRYTYKNKMIYPNTSYDGNIPGIYYFTNTDKYFNIELDKVTNCDLVDVIANNSKDFNEYALVSHLTEYRDLDTYISIMKANKPDTKLKTRFFNTITEDKYEDKTVLLKKATDPKYYNVINDEYNWYELLNNDTICPKIYDNIKDGDLTIGFKMEYLYGYMPLHQYVKSCLSANWHEGIKTTYNTIKHHLNILHTSKKLIPSIGFEIDLRKELIDKVIKRCDDIKDMLINYDKDYMVCLLTKVNDYIIKDYYPGSNVEYSFCHGDLNGSNIMVDPETCDVKFIDPRGYFGNTKLFGWTEYEYAKLLYCLSGYDDFNNLPQIYKYDEPIPLNCLEDIDYLNKKIYKLLVGVIYVALAGYISQDIMKANIAYEYGIKILEHELNETNLNNN